MGLLARGRPRGIVTYSSIHSPQLAIVAACGHRAKLPTEILVGGRARTPYLDLAASLGAKIARQRCARHSALLGEARRRQRRNGFLLVHMGMVDPADLTAQVLLGSRQVRNIPAQARCVVATCGSGLTAASISIGIARYHKRVSTIYLIGTGTSRLAFVSEVAGRIAVARGLPSSSLPMLRYISLPEVSSFRYEQRRPFTMAGIDLHPQYEAKAFRWASENLPLPRKQTLFWITGADHV
jgi:1-aminocyclopropane-1-carboxylate deaminase/D-cysteine desulfhydrase-like pyridoxal-dependent ACC family enzyme